MFRVGFLCLICVVGIYGGVLEHHRNGGPDEVDDREWMLFPDGDGKLHLIHLREDRANPGPRFDPSKHVHFLLYTRKNPSEPQHLVLGDLSSVRSSNFNASTETFFICHGWSNHAGSPVNIHLREAYLQAGDYNVVVVDWATGAGANYFSARGYAATTGQHTGAMINFLASNAEVLLNRIHLRGHSLGAHAMGHAGKSIIKGKAKTLVGLDPAWPLYSVGKPKERIDVTDAEYVEIIHTNGGNLGFYWPLGHADYYPNRGFKQPGCGFDLTGSCAHARSYEYYAESLIGQGTFRAWKCKDVNQMENGVCNNDKNFYYMGGSHDKKRANGVFIVQTADKPPYALH